MLTILGLNSLVFLKDGEQVSMGIRLLYALFVKPVWGLLMAAFIFGMICKVENVYRRILEWPGWVSLVRLTYCSYNVHMLLIRYGFGADTQLYFLSDLHMLITTFGFIVLTFILSTVMWLCVEQPSNNLIKKLGKKSILDSEAGVKKIE
ncbi:unnamed protein product [Diatraea saccharalis]|uniref:Acyltransferase 3 domain-containing protein n=1 Tax=Diatraea saccharalis TaxID=40085 RepID=A0A9N9RE43_9NEOP|nr:unnamed protein product [Diatraea saccharalis]